MKLSTYLLGLGLWLLHIHPIQSQDILDTYIEEGLQNNLILQNRDLSLQASLTALQVAKSYFLPNVEFSSSYTLASGGRTIGIPIGDLLNPVYTTLNQLTGTGNFPQLENVSEQFLPDNFYDAKIRVTLPLLNPDLSAQKKIRKQEIKMSESDLAIYKLELIQDIKTAYYNYCMANAAWEVIEDSEKLVAQNLKTNQSLLKNGKNLPAAVLRAESEVEQVRSLKIEAQNSIINARNYLNFLLNKQLTDTVIYEAIQPNLQYLDELILQEWSGQNPELQKIQTGLAISEIQSQAAKNYWVPRAAFFADLGSQGFDWSFDSQSRYSLMGINLSFPIFQGNRNRNQLIRTQIGKEQLLNQQNLFTQKLNLDWEIATHEAENQVALLLSAQKKLKSSQSYFKLVQRGYTEGVYSLIEFLDARNQLTQAKLQENLANYKLLQAQAKIERLANQGEFPTSRTSSNPNH